MVVELALFVLITVLFLLWIVAVTRDVRQTWRRIDRRSKLLCDRCGYDIRATADRCPECGEPVPPEIRLIANQIPTPHVERSSSTGKET